MGYRRHTLNCLQRATWPTGRGSHCLVTVYRHKSRDVIDRRLKRFVYRHSGEYYAEVKQCISASRLYSNNIFHWLYCAVRWRWTVWHWHRCL